MQPRDAGNLGDDRFKPVRAPPMEVRPQLRMVRSSKRPDPQGTIRCSAGRCLFPRPRKLAAHSSGARLGSGRVARGTKSPELVASHSVADECHGLVRLLPVEVVERVLESNGIVARKVYPVVPPQVEYSLTSLGRTLVLVLDAVCEWTRAHYAEMQKLQKRQEAATREGGGGKKGHGGPEAPAAAETI